jgi:hypothetical protein
MAKMKIGSISPLALALASHPQTFEWSLKTQGYNKRVGTHEFRPVNGKGTPTFAFDHLAAPFPIAQVGKLKNVPAPASACPGLDTEGAVQWLFLKDTTGLSVGGIDTVYRLETAGGSSPATCKDMPESFEVMYAAQCKFNHYDPISERLTNAINRLGLWTSQVSACCSWKLPRKRS